MERGVEGRPMKRYEWVQLVAFSTIYCLLLFGVFHHPVLRDTPNYEQIVAPMRDQLKGESPEVREHAALVNQEGTQTIFHVEGDQYKTQIKAESKALAMFQDPTAYKYVWGSGGDGDVYSDGSAWATGSTSAIMFKVSSSLYLDSFFSFNIGTTFQDTNNVKSVDQIVFTFEVYVSNNEGSEITRIKALVTNNKSGQGGDPPANYAEAIARNGDWAVPRKSGQTDTTALNNVGWGFTGVPAAWIDPGDSGYLTLYLLPLSGWENEPLDSLMIYTDDSGGSHEPYLEIEYTLWSTPVASAANIIDEPTYLFAGFNYTVKTQVTDADGRTNLNDAYLYLSEDHASYRVRFDWDQATNVFSQGEGATYAVLNTTNCSSSEITNGYELTWDFNVTWDWEEGYMDWGNRGTDDQGKDSGINWNDLNTWHTTRLWVHSISVYWIAEAKYLEDGDTVLTSEALNITGYVYWYQTTTAYNLGIGTPRAELVVDGVNEGATYNDSIDATGYYNISYTTPAGEDWDWSLDVELDNLPTEIMEAPSNDNGKNPLFLVAATPAVFGVSGATVTLSIQPDILIPIPDTVQDRGGTGGGGPRMVETNNGEYWRVASTTGSAGAHLFYQSAYWNQSAYIIYDGYATGGSGDETIYLRDYNPEEAIIDQDTQASSPTITGTHVIEAANWRDGTLELQWYVYNTEATGTVLVDQSIINFTSFAETHVATRILNGSQVLDVVSFESKEPATNITISGIPQDYSLITLTGGVSYIDDIAATGTFVVYNTGAGWYSLYLNTSMTWHEVAFSPTLPDGLAGNWEHYQWYANATHITENPFPLSHGDYNLLVKDSFDQTILSDTFNISLDDSRRFQIAKVVPMYKVGITNQDDESYYLEIERNDLTMFQPLPPSGEVHFRVYGLDPPVNYTVYVKFLNGTQRGNFTLSVPDHAISQNIDYVPDVFSLSDFEFSIGKEYFTLLIDTSWDNATVETWVTPHSPDDDEIKVLDAVDENLALQWVITNEERNALWNEVDIKISGSDTLYLWQNFTYSFPKPPEQFFPAYKAEFDSIREELSYFGTSIIQLILFGFMGLIAVMVLQWRGIGKRWFGKPIAETWRKQR